MNSSTGNGWVTVGKVKSSKSKKREGKENKNQPKPIEVVPQYPTEFMDFLEGEKPKPVLAKQEKKEPAVKMLNGGSPKKAAKKKPPKEHREALKMTTNPHFEKDVKRLNLEDLISMLETTKTHFPTSRLTWLKDVAAYLNHCIPYEVADSVFEGQPSDYPTSLVSNGVVQLLQNLLDECQEPTLKLFQEHCLEIISKNMSKGLPTMGYRIFLQILARSNPEITLQNSKIFLIHQATIKSRPDACLTLLWIVSQSMTNNVSYSFKLWQEIFFPLLTLKQFTKYCMQILERLVTLSATYKGKNRDPIPDATFFSILDLLYSSNNTLSVGDKQRFTSIYTQMKKTNLACKGNNKLSGTFKQYFTRLNGTSSATVTSEILGGLVDCLARDSSCFDVWIKLHPNQIMNSVFLLDFLAQDERSSSKLNRKQVSSLVKELTTITKSLMPVKNGARCLSTLEILSVKMSGRRFPWKFVFLVIVAITASAITYDVKSSGNFKNSWTGRTLKNTGVLAVWHESLARVTLHSNRAIEWTQTNVPKYYTNLCRSIGPHVKVARGFLTTWISVIWDSLMPVRQWFNKTVPPLFDHVLENHVPVAVKLINESILSVRRLFVDAGLWIQANVLTGSLAPDNILKMLSDLVARAQVMSSDAYLWISKQVLALKN